MPKINSGKASILSQRRQVSAIPKADLLISLVGLGILTSQDAAVAARGEVPPTFSTLIAGLPDDARVAAEIKWAADAMISRNHPVILAAAYALGIEDSVLDQVFRIQGI